MFVTKNVYQLSGMHGAGISCVKLVRQLLVSLRHSRVSTSINEASGRI